MRSDLDGKPWCCDTHGGRDWSTLVELTHLDEVHEGYNCKVMLNGESRPLVTKKLVELRNNRLKFKTSERIPISFDEFRGYSSN